MKNFILITATENHPWETVTSDHENFEINIRVTQVGSFDRIKCEFKLSLNNKSSRKMTTLHNKREECVLRFRIHSSWGTFPLPRIIKTINRAKSVMKCSLPNSWQEPRRTSMREKHLALFLPDIIFKMLHRPDTSSSRAVFGKNVYLFFPFFKDNNDLSPISDGTKVVFSQVYSSSTSDSKSTAYESMVGVPEHQYMGQPSFVIQQNNSFLSRHGISR